MLSETITGTVTIPLTVLEPQSTATADEDYTLFPANAEIMVSFESGDLTVTIVDDSVSESLETLIFGFGELPDGYVVGSPSTLRSRSQTTTTPTRRVRSRSTVRRRLVRR